LNLAVLGDSLLKSQFPNILIICAGTADESSLEDTYAAGALCDLLRDDEDCELRDSAEIAFAAYNFYGTDFAAHVDNARNGRKLQSISDLRDDIPSCLARDTLNFTATLEGSGGIRRSKK
jgi:phosphosulfolactate phosphohydrolase-like enzyme